MWLEGLLVPSAGNVCREGAGSCCEDQRPFVKSYRSKDVFSFTMACINFNVQGVMMRGWKIILLASTAAILCMAGCGRQEEAICPWANIGAIAETEDSWLCFDGNQLCILSKEENGTIKPWCGKSSCDHTALTDCPAIMDHKFPNTLAADDQMCIRDRFI